MARQVFSNGNEGGAPAAASGGTARSPFGLSRQAASHRFAHRPTGARAAWGYYVVQSFRISAAGGPITEYVEMERKWYPWRWLATMFRGPRIFIARVGPGQFGFIRAEVVPASAMSAGTAETAQQAQGRSPASAVGSEADEASKGEQP